MDILSSHKTFEQICEYAKDIYKFQTMHIQEKIPLAHYINGDKNRRNFFGSTIPFSTHYNSQWYLNITRRELSPKEYRDEFVKHPKFVTIGYDPQLDVREVFNFSFYDQDGVLFMSWEELVGDGSKKKIEQKMPSIFTS